MPIAPREVGKVSTVANLTASGAVGVAAVDTDVRAIVMAQTTAGLSFTLPSPSDTSVITGLDVINTGSASFSMYGVTVNPGSLLRCAWTGSAWVSDVGAVATFTKATVAQLNAMTNVIVGTPAFASNGRAITGVAALSSGFATQAAGAGTGCAVTCATSSATASTWVVAGTTQPLTA